MPRSLSFRLSPFVFIAAFAMSAGSMSPAGAADPPPHAAKLAEGKDFLEEGKHKEAVKALREADKLANGACVECDLGLAMAFNKLGAHKDALKHIDELLKATTDKSHLLQAYDQQGHAYTALAAGDPKQLEQAEKAFRKVLELSDGKINAARLNLGFTLLRLSRDAEGIPLLKEYLEKDPHAPSAEAARELIENPVRARKRLLPDVDFVTLAGEYLTSEELRGKVLLVDFWGTWCAPCRAAVPGLRAMSRRMEKDPFVLVSVSNDMDEGELRKFIAENKMSWPQVWDKDRELTRKLAVTRFPTYLLVSHDGEVVYSASGWGEQIERELNARLGAALRAARKQAPAPGQSR